MAHLAMRPPDPSSTAAADAAAATPAATPTAMAALRAGWAAACAALAVILHLDPTSAVAAPMFYVLACVAAGLACRPKHLIAITAAVTLLVVAGHAAAALAGEESPEGLVAALSLTGVWSAALLLRARRGGFLADGADEGIRALMDSAADAIVVIDGRGRIARFNAAAERLFGYAGGEVIGSNLVTLMPELHRAATGGEIERYLNAEEPHAAGQEFEVDILRRDGTPVPVRLSIGAGRGDGGRSFVGILHDISRRKQTDRVLRRLHEITAAPTLDLDAKIERVLELGADYFHMERGMLCRAENGILSIRNTAPPTTRLDGDAAFAAARPHLLATVAAHEPLAHTTTDAALVEAVEAPETDPAAGYLGVPVFVDWCLYGVLCFVSSTPHGAPVSEGDRDMLQLLAHWIAFEIGRAAQIQALSEAQEELRRQARTDSLTGILNRRHFMRTARIELERCIRYDHPLGLILLDADHFKAINDTHGHSAGDAVLIALAQTCNRMLRGSDAFGRIGGEEFALLLPESDLDATRVVAERTRRAVAELRIPAADDEIALTVSIGLTVRTRADMDIRAMLRRADRALYRAKTGGRDRCVVG